MNDSDALRQADLGIAMNGSGSDLSKESASMILLDDDFNTTLKGIKEGRLIFINMKKVMNSITKALKYSLSHIMTEILPYLLYAVVPIPLAITPTQILAVDLGFEMLMTVSFAWEPAEDEDLVMRMKPRRRVTAESMLSVYERNKATVQSLEVASTNQLDIDESSHLLAEGQTQKDMKLNARLATRYGGYYREARQMGGRRYWRDYIRDMRTLGSASDERLLDGETMVWAYVEAGLLEFAGCIVTYFAIFWIGFGVTPDVARRGQIDGNVHWKPHSPDLILGDGSVLVIA